MNDEADSSKRKVGIYERPASADRPRLIRKIVITVSVIVGLVMLIMLVVG
jgi:hypothetical protein